MYVLISVITEHGTLENSALKIQTKCSK